MPPAPPTLIALLGAPGSGAYELAGALQPQLQPPFRALALSGALQCPYPAALILLLGLDGPGQAADRVWDTECRTQLAAQGCAFQVLYGSGPQRLQAALRAVHAAVPGALHHSPPPHLAERPARLRNWSCEKCSDPECEHRLFTALKGLSPPLS